MPILKLELLNEGFPGVHPIRSTNHLYACLVCLDKQGHLSGIDMKLEGDTAETYQLIWDTKLDDQIRRTWNDLQEATEWGAAAIGFLLILEQTELTIIDRSRKGTGFDYWLGLRADSEKLIFRQQARMEVSGMMEETKKSKIKQRIKEKTKQVTRSNKTTLPVYIIVVEFKTPQAYMVKSS